MQVRAGDGRRHNTADMIDLVFGRRLMFESPLAAADLVARLQREVAPPRLFSTPEASQSFEGTFADGRFRMMRSVRGRNSFRPVISGAVTSGARGTRVDVRLQLHPIVMGLCAIVLLAGATAASIAIPEYLATGSSPGLLVVLALAVVFTAFAITAAVEARKATRMLAAVFETPVRAATASGRGSTFGGQP